MNEKLILDYIKQNHLNTYSDIEIVDISIAGEWVMFKECVPNDWHCKEQHMIPLLDIVAWVYDKVKAV